MLIRSRESLHKIQYGIDKRRPFDVASMHGAKGTTPTGRMPAYWRAVYQVEAGMGKIKYTIRHYETPIAWLRDDGTWMIPDVKYSQHTTHYQRQVGLMIDKPGHYSHS